MHPFQAILLHKLVKLLFADFNKAHPRYSKVGYELKNGFYNAFSMEFVPVREGVKWVRGKLANAISDIKYFATSLVRAPANEGATRNTTLSGTLSNRHFDA